MCVYIYIYILVYRDERERKMIFFPSETKVNQNVCGMKFAFI